MSQGLDKLPIDEYEDQIEYVAPSQMRNAIAALEKELSYMRQQLTNERQLNAYLRNKEQIQSQGSYKPSDLVPPDATWNGWKSYPVNMPQPSHWRQQAAIPPTIKPKKKP